MPAAGPDKAATRVTFDALPETADRFVLVILTKSRAYSTTYGALRAERAHHMGHGGGQDDLPTPVTDRHWRYVGSARTPGAALIAAGIADDLGESRRLGVETKQEGEWRL
ncbi:replication initiator [Streptomyces massasporeus]|uniref:replication initiator n=1 Tax=Streptomyces massasporeus TaxID=67324 RepID=UPI00339ECA27